MKYTVLIFIFLFVGCKKTPMDIPLDSENYGCTDPSACNYDIIANIDDDTCYYTDCPEAIVTFAVNMSYQIEAGTFISGQDILYMVGSFNSWNETNTILSPIEDDYYEVTFSNFTIGDSIIFKFMINNNWESPNPEICIDDGFGGCNRLYIVASSKSRKEYWYNDEGGK